MALATERQRRLMSRALALMWATCVPAIGRAAPLPEPSPSPQIVRIDVVAVDAHGRAVDSLKPADFQLRDDGVPQALEDARFIHPGNDDARAIAIFLDEYHVARESTDRVRAALSTFVEGLRPHDLLVVMKPLDSLFTIHLSTDHAAALEAIAGFEGRIGQYDPRNSYERNYMAGTPERIESARKQIALSAINALAVNLGQISDARKTLIVVTEGFTQPEHRRGFEYLPTIETAVRSAIQANVAVYPMDPSEEPASDGTGDSIRNIALETSGDRIEGSALESGLKRALEDASAYYLLTYRAARPADGKFHSVEVTVKRRSVQLRVRKGYFAPSPDDALRSAVLANVNNPKPPAPLEPAPHVSPLIRPWFGMARGTNGRTQVTIVWEPAGVTPDRFRHVPSRVELKALAADGSVLYDGAIMPTGPGLTESEKATAAEAVFEMAPGRLRLRMSIEDPAAKVIDSDIRSIAVPAIKGDVAIATPEVLRARNAREFRSLNGASVPVSSREFSRTERLLIRSHVYAPATGGRPVVSALLRSRFGGHMRDLPVVASPDGAVTLDVPLAGLAPGDYTVELSAVGTSSRATEVIDFRVTA